MADFEANLASLLVNKDLLPLIHIQLSRNERLTTRLLCSRIREAHDRAVQSLSIRSNLTENEQICVRCSVRMIQRGCRPAQVAVALRAGGRVAKQRAMALELLEACSSGVAASVPHRPLPTTRLEILTSTLCHGVGRAIAAAFPQLRELHLLEGDALGRSEDAEQGLALLLSAGGGGSGNDTGDGSGRGGGEGRGGGDSSGRPLLPLLPQLSTLSISTWTRLPDALLAAVAGCQQLRELHTTAWALSQLLARAPLTQLQALTVRRDMSEDGTQASQLQPAALRDLTSLTHVCWVGGPQDLLCNTNTAPMSAAAFAPLAGLRKLELPNLKLELTQLELLRALTSLSVSGFVLNQNTTAAVGAGAASTGAVGKGAGGGGGGGGAFVGPAAALPPTGMLRPCSVALPPQLVELKLAADAYNPHHLAALRPPSSLTTVELSTSGHSSLMLQAFSHTGGDGSLLPWAEAALCGTAALLAGRQNPHAERSVGVQFSRPLGGGDMLMRPVGGEAGPGRRNHMLWLAALGGLGLQRLMLTGVRLEAEDFTAIAQQLSSLEHLGVYGPTHYPPVALAQLGGMRKLRCLELCADEWSGEGVSAAALREEALEGLGGLYARGSKCHTVELLYHGADMDESRLQEVADEVTKLATEAGVAGAMSLVVFEPWWDEPEDAVGLSEDEEADEEDEQGHWDIDDYYDDPASEDGDDYGWPF